MSNYRRNFVPGGTYFYTVTLLEQKLDLLVSNIELVRTSVRRVKSGSCSPAATIGSMLDRTSRH